MQNPLQISRISAPCTELKSRMHVERQSTPVEFGFLSGLNSSSIGTCQTIKFLKMVVNKNKNKIFKKTFGGKNPIDQRIICVAWLKTISCQPIWLDILNFID